MDWYYALLILYFIFYTLLAVKNLKWAVYTVIFGLPSYLIRFKAGWLPMTLLEVMILILFLVWLLKTLKYKNIKTLKQIILNYRYLFIWTGLFLLSATISVWVSPNFVEAAGIWKAYFIEPVLFLLVVTTIFEKKDLSRILASLLLSALFLSGLAIYQKISGYLINNPFWAAEATRRVTGVFPYPNALALYLAPLAVIFLGYSVYLINSGRRAKLLKKKYLNLEAFFYACAAVLSSAAIYFTKSKGAWLSILAGLFVYLVFYKKARKYFMLFILFLLILFVWGAKSGCINLRGVATVSGGDSVSVRLEMWRETWRMLKNRPWLGAGLAGYQSVMRPYHKKDYIEIYLYPHNLFLNFWSETGLLGMLSFLALLYFFYRLGFRHKKDGWSVIWMAGMTTLLAHGLVDVPYFKNDLSLLFWCLIAGLIISFSGKIMENSAGGI